MALQMIMGPSGSGKSTYILQKIVREAQKNLKKNFYVVVPEQFTMLTQRELAMLQQDHSIMNIDVVSFNRLAYRIFDELGKTGMAVLEETGKSLVLRKVAQDKLEQLGVLRGNITRMGYVNEMKSLISELAQYDISPGDLEEYLNQNSVNPAFSYKMQDVLVLYRGFREYIEGSYITAEEVLEVFREVADQSALLPGSVLVFDCFTGFTPVQNKVLQRLMELVDDIYVTVTLDPKEDPYSYRDMQELFAMSKKTIKSLIRMADQAHFDVKEPVWICQEEIDRFCHAAQLRFIEKNLFRSRAQTMEYTDCGQLRVVTVSNLRMELRYVAQEIVRLVRNDGYRYKEIAVISGAVESYGSFVPEIFDACGIPYFLDTTKDILLHPFLEFIRASLQVVAEDFSYQSVFRYLRCGFSGISQEEIDRLENYVLAVGIRGFAKWERRFAVPAYQMKEEELEELNEVRQRVLAPFLPLREAFGDEKNNVREWTVAFYRFITGLQIEAQLKQREIWYQERLDQVKAREYSQIYRIVMDLFDKMVSLLGEECMSVDEYTKILDAGFDAMQVSVIPSGYDRVMIGDIERSRLDHVKVLFMIGVNDGIVPRVDNRGGILTQPEREELAKHQMELSPTTRDKIFIQRFYIYLAMTKPSDRLYVSYTRVGAGGEAARPSYLITMLKKLFPGLPVTYLEDETLYEQFVTPQNAFAFLLEGIRQEAGWEASREELWKQLVSWYERSDEYRPALERVLTAAGTRYQEEAIGKAVAKALYGNVLSGSVTRLEQFAACACAHFLTYGLGLRERELLEFRMADMGNIYHYALEKYAQYLQKEGVTWFDVQEDMQEALVKRAFEAAVAQAGNPAFSDTARNRYQAERMLVVFRRTIWALTRQLRQGRFEPEGVEMSFAFTDDLSAVNFALSEEERMHLRGRIDRVDTYETGDKVYVKIIDYKSGNTGFELLSLYHGLQLQLVVYLNAAMEVIGKKKRGKEVIPAGMFYYHIDDPVIEGDGTESDTMIYEKILEKLKVDGVISTEVEAYRAMDMNFSGKSTVIPLSINKDGTVRSSEKAADPEQFALISEYAGYMVKKCGQEIMHGDTAVRPYELKDKSSCVYCPYGSVCGFDRRLPGHSMRALPVLSPEEIYEKMKEATE